MASTKRNIVRKAGTITVVWTSGIPNELQGLTFTPKPRSPYGQRVGYSFPVKQSELRSLATALSDIADELEGKQPATPAKKPSGPRAKAKEPTVKLSSDDVGLRLKGLFNEPVAARKRPRRK